jgi:hypothetical protein
MSTTFDLLVLLMFIILFVKVTIRTIICKLFRTIWEPRDCVFIAKGTSVTMGVQTVEVSSVNRPSTLLPPPLVLPPTTTESRSIAITASDVEKGATSADQWGKNMQRWRNDNIDIGTGS